MVHLTKNIPVAIVVLTSQMTLAFDLMKNPYMEPGPSDLRSPCPALSALANHGFINRDGREISTNELAIISAEVFSISNQSAHFVMEKNIQLGMPHQNVAGDIIFDLERTKVVDRDVSFSWLDRQFRNVDQPNDCLITKLMDLAGDSEYLTPDDMDEFIRIRYADSKKFNPNFKFTEHTISLMGVQVAEMFTVSDDPTLETVNKTVLYDFLKLNKFSDGYMPRNVTLPFQPLIDDSDPSALLIKRFTDLVAELDGQDDNVATARAASDLEAMCILEQPPKPPTTSPTMMPTRMPVEAPVSSASTWSNIAVSSLMMMGLAAVVLIV